jgi:hypothetical protein
VDDQIGDKGISYDLSNTVRLHRLSNDPSTVMESARGTRLASRIRVQRTT